jgi:general secretion pathway protein G
MNSKGFTLIEVAVVLAVIAVLAGVLTPIVGDYVDEARRTRATGDAQALAGAILSFNKDTGKWPIFVTAGTITTSSTIYTILQGPGTDPNCSGCGSTWLPSAPNRGELEAILERNTPGYTTSGKFAWRGPYTNSIGSDPWGNRYLINASSLGFGLKKAAFVLSAGPNGIVETTFDQNIGSGSVAVTAGGDDIVARIR